MSAIAPSADAWVLEALKGSKAPRGVLGLTERLLAYRGLMGPAVASLVDLEADPRPVRWVLEHALRELDAGSAPWSASGDACLFLLTGSREIGELAGARLAACETDRFWAQDPWRAVFKQWTYAWGQDSRDGANWQAPFEAWSAETTLEARLVRLYLTLANGQNEGQILRGLALGAVLSMRPGMAGLHPQMARVLAERPDPALTPRALRKRRAEAGLIPEGKADLRMWVQRDLHCRLNRYGMARGRQEGAGHESKIALLDFPIGEAQVGFGWLVLALASRRGWSHDVPSIAPPAPHEDYRQKDGIRWSRLALFDFGNEDARWLEALKAAWWLPKPDLLGSGQVAAQVALAMDELWRDQRRDVVRAQPGEAAS